MSKKSEMGMNVSFYISSFKSDGSGLRVYLEKSAFEFESIYFETIQSMAFAHEFDIRGLISDIGLQKYRYCINDTGVFKLEKSIIQNHKSDEIIEICEEPNIYWISTPDEILEVISFDEPVFIFDDMSADPLQ